MHGKYFHVELEISDFFPILALYIFIYTSCIDPNEVLKQEKKYIKIENNKHKKLIKTIKYIRINADLLNLCMF